MSSKLNKQKQILALLNSRDASETPDGDNDVAGEQPVRRDEEPVATDRLISQIFHFHKSIIQNINAGLITISPDGEITFANKIAGHLLGYEPDEMPGRNLKYFFKSMENAERFFHTIALPGKKIDDWESVFIHKSKKEIVVEINASRFEDVKNSFQGVVCLLRDVTEVAQLRQQVGRMERLAFLGELSAGIAHEVRNPLAGIKASTQLLEDQRENRELQEELIRRIVREVDKADRLLQEFFKFARPARPQPAFHDLTILLENCHWLVNTRLKNMQIQQHQEIAKSLPKIYADASQIEQVLLNLMLNAIDAMDAGGTLSIRAYKKRMLPLKQGKKDFGILNQPFDYVMIEISDTGPGIEESEIEKIFNPFYTTKSGGLGLGLSISSRLVEENNGKIDVVSHNDQGTTFILALPAFLR